MGAGVVTIGRRIYAAGLYWENSPSGRVAQAAKEAASQPGQEADFYAVRGAGKSGRVPQFGLGQAAAGHKAGMPVFAACLANQQPGSWAGAFRLREGTVVTIVRDDLIVPDGDQFFLNEGEARDRLLQEMGFGGLQRVYAPESWAIPGADTMPISLLLDERRDIRLQVVRIPKQYLIAAAVAAAILVLTIGGVWYYQKEQERQAQIERDRLDALERARLAAQQSLPAQFQQQQIEYPPPERVWEKKPPALAVIQSCQVGLSKVPSAVAGWNLTQLRCDGSGINLTWSRSQGFAKVPAESAIINETGTTASLTIPLSALMARGPEGLVDPDEVARRYLAQNWPGSITRLPEDPPPPPPPGFQGNWAPPPTPWVKRSFTVTVRELPASLPLFFGDLPGTTVNSLNFSPGGNGGGTWTVEGIIYENRV
ncbi:MAG: type 4b pilus protein PilO2 [Alphaproteobacteria bacterium]|nr:type 4b pilus protein PilO2 [Alphaproteobacteria bacterium]